MELFQGIMSRKSCRAYKSTPILTDVMNRVLEAACRSPSYTNTQPWEVAVVRGDKRRELSVILCGLAESGAPVSADIPLPTAWPPDLDQRSREHGARRFKALGVERESEAQRKELRMMNYRFYGAPSVIFIFIDSSLTTWSVFDAGLVCPDSLSGSSLRRTRNMSAGVAGLVSRRCSPVPRVSTDETTCDRLVDRLSGPGCQNKCLCEYEGRSERVCEALRIGNE